MGNKHVVLVAAQQQHTVVASAGSVVHMAMLFKVACHAGVLGRVMTNHMGQ
jgi:hypothetical protein